MLYIILLEIVVSDERLRLLCNILLYRIVQPPTCAYRRWQCSASIYYTDRYIMLLYVYYEIDTRKRVL